jgi:chitinase
MNLYAPSQTVLPASFTATQGWDSFDTSPRLLADINGDGRSDIVAFGYSAVYSALGQADGRFTPPAIATTAFTTATGWPNFDLNPRQLGDVNADGRADIIGFSNDQVWVALGQTNGTFTAPIVALTDNYTMNQGWSSFDRFPRQIADVNGDGSADIIGFAYFDVYVALGRRDGTFADPIGVEQPGFTEGGGGWSSFDAYPRQVADMNGDGRADIIGFGWDDIYVSLGQANGRFSNPQIALSNNFTPNDYGWNRFQTFPRLMADINGDDRADIVGFGYSDITAALGQANGTFAAPTIVNDQAFTVSRGGWSGFDTNVRQLGDVNGDGRADIVGFGPTGVEVALAINPLTPPVTPPVVIPPIVTPPIVPPVVTPPVVVTPPNPPALNSRIVMGNLPYWKIAPGMDLSTIPADRLTHITYDFLDVAPDGTTSLYAGEAGDLSVLTALKQKYPKLKILLSLGGAGNIELDFPAATDTFADRQRMINSSIALMRNAGLDGIDIDWETPLRSQNSQYLQLLQEFDQALNAVGTIDNKAYQLSTDLPAGPYNLASQDYDSIYDFNPGFLKSVSQSVDFINVMNYVYHGAWYEFTGHDAPLFSNPLDTSYNNQKTNTDWSIDQYIAAGVNPQKLLLGLPAFGFRWNNVADPLQNGGYLQPGQGEWNELAYSDIVNLKSQPGYEYHWDDMAQVPYLYNATTQQFISYNDPRSVAAKAAYVQQNGLGGVFFWQIMSDVPIDNPNSLIHVVGI